MTAKNTLELWFNKLLSTTIHHTFTNYINVINFDDLPLILLSINEIPQHMHHPNTVIDNILHNSSMCVLDKYTMDTILMYPKIATMTTATSIVIPIESSLIYETTICEKHACLFYYDTKWYITYCNNIVLADKYINVNNITNLDKIIHYYFQLRHPDFRQYGINDAKIECLFLYGMKNNNIITDIKLEFCDNSINIVIPHMNDLMLSLWNMHLETIANKKVSNIGYVCVTNTGIYYFYTEIYKLIMTNMATYTNQHMSYLYMYQTDKLYDILPYMHKYHKDVIKRINMALKTLSKEILNIYHKTRKHKNSKLYELLSPNIKKILYDLHYLYISNKLKNNNENDTFSITVATVYDYLKNLNTQNLKLCFFDRKKLVEDIKNKGLSVDVICDKYVDIIILTELLL